MKNLVISKYHLVVILLYALLVPLLYIFPHTGLNYGLRYGDLKAIAIIATISILIFLYFLGSRQIKPGITSPWSVFVATIYALIFAFPEEIVFRGVIQNFFESYFSSATVGVILSAVIFGLAHVYNGARGYLPRAWNWKLVGLAFLAGFPLGAIYALTNSLLVPTLLHAFFLFILKLREKS